jgi:hypothetical protein
LPPYARFATPLPPACNTKARCRFHTLPKGRRHTAKHKRISRAIPGAPLCCLKNATNDIKIEIQKKRAEANGLDTKSLSDMTGNINSQF